MWQESGNAWRTGRGQALAVEALTHAVNRRPVLLHARHAGAATLLAESANELSYHAHHVTHTAGRTPQACIEALVPPDVRAAARGELLPLIASDDLRDAVIIVEAAPEAFKSWLAFVGLFASVRRHYDGPAASLVVLTPEHCSAPNHCVVLNDDDIVDVLDALLFVRDRSNWSRSRLAQTAAAVVVEVCRGDLDQIDCLLGPSPEHFLDPTAALRNLEPSNDKRLLKWRDQEEPCPTWLLAHDPARLSDRILRGQLSVLFPWLEETRSLVTRRGARQLPAGVENKVTGDRLSVPDYEFAHIVIALIQSGAPRVQIDAAVTLRDSRNDLAHGTPLSSARLAAAQSAARTLVAALGKQS